MTRYTNPALAPLVALMLDFAEAGIERFGSVEAFQAALEQYNAEQRVSA